MEDLTKKRERFQEDDKILIEGIERLCKDEIEYYYRGKKMIIPTRIKLEEYPMIEILNKDEMSSEEDYNCDVPMSIGTSTTEIGLLCFHCGEEVKLPLKSRKRIAIAKNDCRIKPHHFLEINSKSQVVFGFCSAHGGKLYYSKWAYEEVMKVRKGKNRAKKNGSKSRKNKR